MNPEQSISLTWAPKLKFFLPQVNHGHGQEEELGQSMHSYFLQVPRHMVEKHLTDTHFKETCQMS